MNHSLALRAGIQTQIAVLALAVILCATLAVAVTAEDTIQSNAGTWRAGQLQRIDQQLRESASEDERLELAARKAWLRRWKPGQMPTAPQPSSLQPPLVDEPQLTTLSRPEGVGSNEWMELVAKQTRLLELDTDEDRKDNLKQIIEVATEFESMLTKKLPASLQGLETKTGWTLAFARYRLGRALAYRELPVVREKWPITDTKRYDDRLRDAYQRLVDQAERGRPEFILLEDRMLRRSGQKGQALELLEANRNAIEPRWYLKKRRDLLQELGWTPAYEEAAQLYAESGLSEESPQFDP
ncbi:hypothetical protein [Stieleria varia]|uniref:hypothetical protein n=1 Tax=Stieleria varia TaxID=2528005 RepID=UPI001E611989|nr:hypothetical protein [Stieleria varia]